MFAELTKYYFVKRQNHYIRFNFKINSCTNNSPYSYSDQFQELAVYKAKPVAGLDGP
jgi:hypothetical protein